MLSENKNSFLDHYLIKLCGIILTAFWSIFGLFYFKAFYYRGSGDFLTFYKAFRMFLSNPSNLYGVHAFFYFPSFALVFCWLGLFSYDVAYIIYSVFCGIVTFFIILEIEKILKLLNINTKIMKMIIAGIIFSGWGNVLLVVAGQKEALLIFTLLFVVRRELAYPKEKKNWKYYLLNNSLFLFTIGTAPYMVFFFIITLFYDIKISELFRKDNVKNYLIIVISFLIQNCLFLIYPNLIFDYFTQSVEFTELNQWKFHMFIDLFPIYGPGLVEIFNSLYYPFLITDFIACLLITFYPTNRALYERFGIFSTIHIFLDVFKGWYEWVMLIPVMALLILKYIKEKDKFFDNIKTNLIPVCALVMLLIFKHNNPYISFFFHNFPFLQIGILFYIVSVRCIIIIGAFAIFFILSDIKAKKNKQILTD